MLMSTVEIRSEINRYLDLVQDESFLKVVHSMLGTYLEQQEDEIIGYRIDSDEPIYKSKLGDELDAIVKEVEEGDFITLEDLKAESETW